MTSVRILSLLSLVFNTLFCRNADWSVPGIFVQVSDRRGHRFGAKSAQVKSLIRNIDNTVGRILRVMQDQDLTGKVTLMIVSGHGMTDVSRKRIIRIHKLVDTEDVEIFTGRGAFLSVWPKPEKMNKVRKAPSK